MTQRKERKEGRVKEGKEKRERESTKRKGQINGLGI